MGVPVGHAFGFFDVRLGITLGLPLGTPVGKGESSIESVDNLVGSGVAIVW